MYLQVVSVGEQDLKSHSLPMDFSDPGYGPSGRGMSSSSATGSYPGGKLEGSGISSSSAMIHKKDDSERSSLAYLPSQHRCPTRLEEALRRKIRFLDEILGSSSSRRSMYGIPGGATPNGFMTGS